VRARTRITLFVVIVALVTGGLLVLSRNCPDVGFALTDKARTLHRLKNRKTIPQESDFDKRVTLNELLQPGDDTSRWSAQHAARIEAFVVDLAYARPEATNCFLPWRRDIHIVLANRAGAPKSEQIILEVTPNIREWAEQSGLDWSEAALKPQLVGHWCEFEGWLYFDEGHADKSENTNPHDPTNWRATAWEIHPVTSIKVIK
jgi:hypothetical protein